MTDENEKRPLPPKPKKPPSGLGDIVISMGEDEPYPAPEGTSELARWTGDLLLGMTPADAVELATDLLLAARNARGEMVQIWLPTSTARIYRPEPR